MHFCRLIHPQILLRRRNSFALAEAADDLRDYIRDRQAGDVAATDLDAVTFAADLQGNGSDYFMTMSLLEILLE